MNEQKRAKDLFSSILFLISYLLLLEWIYPLKQIANTGISLFIIFIAISFLLYIMNAPIGIVITIKTIYIFISLHHIFYDTSLIKLSWLRYFIEDVFHNIKLLFSRDWDHLTNPFRSLLFFILLWLITYLLRYWLVVKKNILLFFVMTIMYITVLDTFTLYYGNAAIVRSIILGFGLLGLLFFQRFIEKERLVNSQRLMAKWVIPLSIMVFASTSFAFIIPKASPIWPDPVPFLKAYAGKDNQGKGSGISQVGYRADDSSLGGPFVSNDEVVFRVQSESRQYWRIETKDIYTGKGWQSAGENVESSYGMLADIPVSSSDQVDQYDREVTAIITKVKPGPNISYPYGLTKIHPFEHQDYGFLVDNMTEKINVVQNEVTLDVKKYGVTYHVPQYSVKKMSERHSDNFQADPRFTQIPGSLPERVRNLAEEITKDKKNEYEKTKAVESYFSNGQFTYDQKNVATPSDEDDYVDQFLFDTKRGYCDNFSTSMVVLLRSVGIPARWVKGYSSGEFEGTVDATYNTYRITNNNAHSWVEVFFPNVGWVPFEPTIGFTNNSVFNNDVDQSSKPAGTTDNDIKNRDDLKEQPQQQLPKDQAIQSNNFSMRTVWEDTVEYLHNHWLFISFIFLLCCLVGLWVYSKRIKWIPFVLVWRYRGASGTETFTKAYLSLLKQLGRYGLQKQDGQTLRDYANQVDTLFDTSTMRQLTERYERNIYRGQDTVNDWKQSRELWENLIKKTTG